MLEPEATLQCRPSPRADQEAASNRGTSAPPVVAQISDPTLSDALLCEGAQIPIVESDKRMVITYCNAATTAVFGYSAEELIGQRVNILMQPTDSRKHDGYIGAYERSGVKKILATTGRTVDGRHKNGSALTLQLTTSSTPKGYAAVFVDMTAHVDTERALAVQQARTDAERSMKDFLAHEVRNPLSVAVAALRFASSAIGDEAPPGVRSDLQMVSSSLEYIDDLLTGMLDLSKATAGKIMLHPERCSLVHDVLTPVVHMLGGRGGGGGGSSFNRSQGAASEPILEVDETVLQGDPLMVKVDSLRLKQVCVNLTKNALKFVPAGFIRLGAKRKCSSGSDGDMKSGGGSMVEIWVEDSGPGIPHAKAESLFEKFTQLHGHDKGTGIGLSLCREIVDGMGGTIRVDTTYTSGSAAFGPGSRFVVEIPLLPAEEEEKEKEKDAEEAPSSPSSLPSPVPLSPQHSADDDDEALLRRTASWRVLAVDDVEMVRKLLVRTLKAALGAGCVVVEAASSREALAAIKASSAREDNPFDLIVLDEHMDSNDDSEQQLTSGGENSRSGGSVDVFGPKGTDLARHLRAKGSTAVIAGFSGDDMEAEHKAAGCDLSWRKTVTASSMRAGLLECLRKGIWE